MATLPVEVTLEVSPRARFDVIDVRRRVAQEYHDVLDVYSRALYCSFHTTAGYLEQSLASRLEHRRDRVAPYVQLFRTLFPQGADYEHDKLHLRQELSDEQRRVEPRNADSHLAFIGAGLTPVVSYVNRPGNPVYFVDLDGLNGEQPRRRQTTVLGFDDEEVVARERLSVPVSAHPVDSINLKNPRLGFYEQIQGLVARHGVEKGRVHLSLAVTERQAGLTINEYETLLMRHDLADVLHDPLRFVAEKSRSLLAHPRAIPNKTIDYAKYDLVRVFNEIFDALGLRESFVEQIVSRVIALPASRFLRMKRAVSLLVSDRDRSGCGTLVQGQYQSPILVQWHKAARGQRHVDVTLTRFR
ncbi:MAG: hypothetical protein GEU99_23640 [Luteitalea sp.]|nr:hypothetical protein [Luteitalea sp.]